MTSSDLPDAIVAAAKALGGGQEELTMRWNRGRKKWEAFIASAPPRTSGRWATTLAPTPDEALRDLLAQLDALRDARGRQ